MVYIFWGAIVFVLYVLGGYGVCLWLLLPLRRKARREAPVLPNVSVLIVIRGGENAIEKKLRNTLALNYPADKLEIVVVCDGPSPRAEEIVQRFADRGVRLVRAEARGKAHGLQLALNATSGEIVVFTDVGVMMDAHGLCTMVSNFADPTVGCVSSEDVTQSSDANAEPAYISFEMRLRRLESAVCSLVSASGSLFAARREVCRFWHEGLSSDFFVPLHAIEVGYDVVVDARVLGHVGSVQARDEFQRKVRTIVHGLDVLFAHWNLLNPFRYGLFAWELASHKLCRWLLPFAFGAALLANCFLWNAGCFYRGTLVCQVLLHTAGLLRHVHPRLASLFPVRIAAYFLNANLATLVAWVKFFSGEHYATWEPSRR
jgi:hypothetical protein